MLTLRPPAAILQEYCKSLRHDAAIQNDCNRHIEALGSNLVFPTTCKERAVLDTAQTKLIALVKVLEPFDLQSLRLQARQSP